MRGEGKEKRRNRRIEYHLPVFLQQGSGGTTYGEIQNLSDGGVFINTSVLGSSRGSFNMEEEATATFYFLGKSSTVSMTLTGRIVRITDGGLAFQSDELETCTFLNFDALVLRYDSNHPELAERCLNHVSRHRIPTAPVANA